MKKHNTTEPEFLTMLEEVLKMLAPEKAGVLYDSTAKRLRLKRNLCAMDTFTREGALADAEDGTIAQLESELTSKFSDAGAVSLEIAEDRTKVIARLQLANHAWLGHLAGTGFGWPIRVDATIALGEKPVVAPWVPFPFSLPGDPDNVWLLARREDFGPDEAARALATIEEEFWQTKKGLKLLKKRVEKCFAEFIQHVPSSKLKDSHMKRHYKEPEVVKTAGGGQAAAGGDRSSVNGEQSQAHVERSVGLAAHMYGIRDEVRSALGVDYLRVARNWQVLIRERAAKDGIDELKAMMALGEEKRNVLGATDALVAAYVEMMEPSTEVKG